MRKRLIAVLFLAVCCSGQYSARPTALQDAGGAPPAPRHEPLWMTEGFAAPGGGQFISNIADDPAAKDGEGWISLLGENGTVVVERFAEGLDAPKGMAVRDGVLYASDIDAVRLFNAESGAPRGVVPIAGAKFLNDATLWIGVVYVSDSAGATIYRIEDGEAVAWLADDRLGGVNGLFGAGDTLLIFTMDSGSLNAADANGALAEIARHEKRGQRRHRSGRRLACFVMARRDFLRFPSGGITQLLDTREEDVLQNDLTMFGDVVIVPNLRPGAVTAWKAVR